jgi:hypothetical protein
MPEIRHFSALMACLVGMGMCREQHPQPNRVDNVEKTKTPHHS